MPAVLPILLAAGALWTAPCPTAQPLTVTTLCLINHVRAEHGARELRLDPRLRRAAERHSRDMVAHRYFSHTSRSGLSSSGRIARTGWMRGRRRWTVGENLAWHNEPAGARWVVRAWLRSPEHRHVLLNRRYRVAGIGVSRGTPFATPGATFTADFGS